MNWLGTEERPQPPKGLNVHGLDWYLTFLEQHGFNAIRLPFNHRDMLDNPVISLDDAQFADPSWTGLTYREMFHRIALEAGKRGFLVVLVCSRPTREVQLETDGGGLWFTEDVGEHDIMLSWEAIADLLCDVWNVVGMDLQDDPVPRNPHPSIHSDA